MHNIHNIYKHPYPLKSLFCGNMTDSLLGDNYEVGGIKDKNMNKVLYENLNYLN